MNIQNTVAFVTGANRGLGLAIVKELQARGVKKIYAAARNPAQITVPGVIPVKLDVTSLADIAAAAEACGDVTLLVNNAGIAYPAGFQAADTEEAVETIFATNVLGPIRLSRAFAPALARNGGGAIANVLSIVSWVGSTMLGVYAASKAAAWSHTNTLRQELAAQGTQVVGLHVGFMDTDLTAGFEVPKVSPESVAAQLVDGLVAGASEVLADEPTRFVKSGLSAEKAVYLTALPV